MGVNSIVNIRATDMLASTVKVFLTSANFNSQDAAHSDHKKHKTHRASKSKSRNNLCHSVKLLTWMWHHERMWIVAS